MLPVQHMQTYIFLDLDDTLFQTLRKCPTPLTEHPVVVRAYLPDGTPNSFATAKQQWLWAWLQQTGKVIPVTARDHAAFHRVNLAFTEEIILNHGAVILDKQGQLDSFWMAKMRSELTDAYPHLFSVWKKIEAYCQHNSGYTLRLVSDFDTIWYGVVKHSEGTEAILKAILDDILITTSAFTEGHLYWHLNGNNLAVLPACINKQYAVSYLLQRYTKQHGEIVSFAAGDSKTDAAFMALCDYAFIPKNTQLHSELLSIK